MPEPLRLRVQRPDGTPVADARVLVAVRGEPFLPRPGGTVKTAPVELVTDAAGLAAGDVVPGTLVVRVVGETTVELEHEGDASAPPLFAPITVSGMRRAADGTPAVLPVTFRPPAVRLIGRTIVTRAPVTAVPVGGVVTVALVEGAYIASQPGERAGTVEVPGGWLVDVPVGEWLLSGGVWNDVGAWDDAAEWSDAA